MQEKNEKNANNSQELWKALNTSYKMKSGKVNRSKSALWKDGAIQFEPIKNANTFKDFYSDLARNIVRKLPVALSKFNNNLMKQYQLHWYREKLMTLNYVMQYRELLKRF